MPDPRIAARFARDIAGWYGDVGRRAEKEVLTEAQRYGREAGRFGSPDIGGGNEFLSGALLGKPTSVDYSQLSKMDGQPYGFPRTRGESGFTTFNEHVNEGLFPGFDMHAHPPLGSDGAPYLTQPEAKNAMTRGVAGPLAPSGGDFSVWLRHYDPAHGTFRPRPEIKQTAYIQGSQPRSLLAMGSPDFNEGLLPGIAPVAPADLYKVMSGLNDKRSDLWRDLKQSQTATDVVRDYSATLPELWAAIHTNRMAQRGVPMTFEDRAPFGKGWLQDAMSDFYKTSDRRGEGFEQGGPVEMDTGGGVLRKLIHAYHGSPYAFSRFDPTKIGSGEGAQAYGYGHYFTDKEEIARRYRDKLVKRALPDATMDDPAYRAFLATQLNGGFDQALDALRGNSHAVSNGPVIEALLSGAYKKHEPSRGHMYDVNLGVNPQDLLNWDAPLSTQTRMWDKIDPSVRRYIDESMEDRGNNSFSDALDGYTGRHLYGALKHPDVHDALPDELPRSSWLTGETTPKRHTADYLKSLDIPGIKYLDGFSRGAGEGTSNYVIFPGGEKDIIINRRYANGGPVNTPTEGEGGMYGAPDSMFNTPESLAAALYPQHDTAYGGGGKVLRKAGQLARDALLGDLPEYKPGEETYLRFGKWPKSERSRNYIEGGREEGVSVYPLAPHGGPPLDWSDSGELDSHRYQRLKGSVFPYSPANPMQDHNHPSFFVQGREVGIGQDGEPLLREVKPLSRDWHSPQVGDNEAAPLSYFHRYDDEPLPSVVKPFDGQFADGGPVHMALGGTPPNTAPTVPDMPQLSESEGAGYFRNNDYENYAGPENWLKKLGAPTIQRPGKVQDVHNWASKVGGAEQGRRVEQAADLTNLGHFSSNALHETFAPGNSSLLMALPPGRFEDFSARLPAEYMARTPYGRYRTEWLRQNSVPGHGRIPDSEKTMDAYLSQLFHHMATKGADEVPTMWLAPPRPLYGEVAQHQGRHRARAMAQAGEENMLLHIKPANDGDMRGSLAERLERLTDKYFPSGAATRFEPEMDWKRRIPLSFPFAPFAEGGEVEMAGGGADKIKEAVGFLRRLSKYNDAPSKHIDDFQWKPMSEVGERLGQIDAIPPHVENFGGFMQEQAQRAANEGLTPRDLLKAYGITRSSIQRKARPADSVRAGGLPISSDIKDMVRPEGAFATWMGTPHGQSWLDKGERGIVDFDAIDDAKQKLAMFGKNQKDIPQFLQWGPENLPGREGRISELVRRALNPADSSPLDWKNAVGDISGLGPAKRGFFSAMLGRGDQPVFDARQIGLNVPKGNYSGKYERRGGGEGGDEIMARLAARQNALGIGVPKDLMPFQQYLTHHTTWDRLGNEATTHQDLIDSLRGHAEGGPIEMSTGGQYDAPESEGDGFFRRNDVGDMYAGPVQTVKRLIMPHARSESRVVPNRDIESRYWDHKKPPNLDTIFGEYADHPPVDVPTMKIEDIAGGRLIAVPHDRSATDVTLHGYNGNTFADPVTSPGGPKFAFGRNPEAVTASGESVIKKLHEAAVQSAEEGRTPYLAPWLMGPHGVDFSTHMNEAVAQSLPFLKVPMAKRDEVNKLLAGVFTDFPGIEDKDLVSYLHNMVGTTRRDLPKLLDKAEMVNAGLDVGGLRAALTDPGLLHAPYGSSGSAISRIDPSKSPTMFGYPNHPSYPWQLQGTPVGGLDPMVPPQILYPDFFRSLPPETHLGPKGKPVNNRRAFEMSSMKGGVGQDVNDEVINKVNEYQEYMRKIRGRKEGGTVEDQYHPIWQQNFQAGGQPESESRGYYTKKEQAAIARQRNAERIGEITAESNANPGAYWRDLLTQIPRGAASIAELPGLAGDLLNYRADYLDSVAPGSGSMRVPHWGTSEGISQGLDSVFPETTTKNGAAAGRELGEMGLNMFGLGMAQKMNRFAHMGNAANLGFILGGGSGNDTEPAEWQAPPEPSYAYERFMRDHAPKHQAYNPSFHGYAHGGSVEDQYHPIWSQNFKDGGPVEMAFGGGFAPSGGGMGDGGMPWMSLLQDGMSLGKHIEGGQGQLEQQSGTYPYDPASGLWQLTDPDRENYDQGELIGGDIGRGVGGVIGSFFGPFQPLFREGFGRLGSGIGAMVQGNFGEGFSDLAEGTPFDFLFADGGPVKMSFGGGFAPSAPTNDFTEPGMPSFGVGIPGFDVPPLPFNSQVARAAAERERLLRMTEQASQKGLADQMKPKDSGGGGGGGMGDIMGMAMKMAPQIMSMMASHGGPVGHYADGGSIPAPNGEQPWMYGGGALMARGGYLRGHGGMNG